MKKSSQIHNLEAEMGVLGSMLLSRSVGRMVLARAQERIFHRHAHQLLFRAMCDIIEQGGECDFITLKNELGSNLEDAGGENYILQIAEFVPSPANWETYLEIVQKLWRRRMIVEIGERVSNDDEYDVDEATLMTLVGPVSTTAPVRIGEVEGAEKPRVLVPTGFGPIDEASGGIGLGGTAVVLAGSGAGKSAFCVHRAIHAARNGYPVLYLSLMDLDEVSMRRRAMQALTGWSHKPNGGDPLSEWQAAEKELNEAEIYLHAPYKYRGGNRLSNLVALIERARHKMGVKVVILDYVQRIQHDPKANEYAASLYAENELTLLANRLNIVIWYASQGTDGPNGLVTKGGKHWNEGAECTILLESMTQAQIAAEAKYDSLFLQRFTGRAPIRIECQKMRHARRFKTFFGYMNDRLDVVEP